MWPYAKTLYHTLAWKGPDECGHTSAGFETTLCFAISYEEIRLGNFFFLTLVACSSSSWKRNSNWSRFLLEFLYFSPSHSVASETISTLSIFRRISVS